ncbi:MAG: hypothetical protein WC389_08065 [Lutibacter sp.]|jgi:hypothetical protein
MSDKDLICGCGSEAKVYEIQRKSLGGVDEYFVQCGKCLVDTECYATQKEAEDVFRLATRADLVKQQAEKIEKIKKYIDDPENGDKIVFSQIIRNILNQKL